MEALPANKKVMNHVAQELEKAGLKIPVMIGGATTSKAHTAVKLEKDGYKILDSFKRKYTMTDKDFALRGKVVNE